MFAVSSQHPISQGRPVARVVAQWSGQGVAGATGVQYADRVLFGSAAKAEDQAAKVARTNEEAVALFVKNKTEDQLLAALSEKFRNTPYHLEIYDGRRQDQAWVNDVCSIYGNHAFFLPSDMALYGRPYNRANAPAQKPGWGQQAVAFLASPLKLLGFKTSPEPGTGGSPFPEVFEKHVLPGLETPGPGGKKKLAIFVSRNGGIGSLRHEIFHALQLKNGLPFGTTFESDEAAIRLRNAYDRPVAQLYHPNRFVNGLIAKPINSLVNMLWTFGRSAFAWGVEVPLAQLKRLVTGRKPNTVGDALRVNTAREKEVDLFYLKHGGKAGLPALERYQYVLYYALKDKLHELRSDLYN